MEPALILLVALGAGCGLALVVDLVGSAAGAIARGSVVVPPPLKRFIVGAVLIGAVAATRSGPASATTPPPSVRIAAVAAARTEAPPSSMPTRVSTIASHTVEAGDCLWRIARDRLVAAGREASGHAITTMWRRIYDRNRSIIGPDPNLIHPGQVLSLPEV